MKCIIPLAGLGTRLRPHTHSKAKPLLHIAGRPVLDYILEEVEKAGIRDVVFIIGHKGEQIREYASKKPGISPVFVEQKELSGQAHAILLAREHIDQDVVIWFSDTLTEVNLKEVSKRDCDGAIFAKEVENPKRFGVVEFSNGFVTRIIEKPDNPNSNLVNIGLYYVKNHKMLLEALDELMQNRKKTKGEYYLVDAFNIMISKGARFLVEEVAVWEDAGKQDTLLKANRFYLERGRHKESASKNSVIIRPVYIEDNAVIENSVIGPYVSVGAGAVIRNSVIRNSIIGVKAGISHAAMKDSIVGDEAVIRGSEKTFNVGDHSEFFEG